MRLTADEIEEIWQSLSIGEDEIDMHEYAEAIETAVLAKLADKLLESWSGLDPDAIIDAAMLASKE